MGDMGDYFREYREMDQLRKDTNMKRNLDYLNFIEADYEVYNHGYQLNFKTPLGVIAFYPSTNKWVLKGKTYFGTAKNLVNWITNQLKGG